MQVIWVLFCVFFSYLAVLYVKYLTLVVWLLVGGAAGETVGQRGC